ncbi:MAG: amino acid kinase family protein [Gammaproteobacteria bacterium]
MKVVKIGGSLEQAGSLKNCLASVVSQNQGRIVIVPGGGSFADQVRQAQRRWSFDDSYAHRMAILAMQQMALLFNALNQQLQLSGSVADIKHGLESGHCAVWSPDIKELDSAGIEACWDITSDSLAAWLATELRASELILIKSSVIPNHAGIKELADAGIVDQAFIRFTQYSEYKITIIDTKSL